MLIIMKKYSRIILPTLALMLTFPTLSLSVETPELGDPYSQTMSLKTEEIIGLSSYKRLQKNNFINNDPLVSSYINYLGNKLSRNIMDNDRKYT